MKFFRLFILFFLITHEVYATSPENLLKQVLIATESVKNFECRSRMIERNGHKLITNESFSLTSYTPFRIYMTNLTSGMQILYNPTLTDGKLFVKVPPVTFVTLKFTPESSMARDDYHHPIYYSGTRFAAKLLRKISQNLSNYTLSKISTNSFFGQPVFVLTLYSKNFSYIQYTVKKTESLQNLCSKMLINEYLVLTHNKNIHNYNQILTAGTSIIIPSDFFKQLRVFIDQKSFLPLVEKIWDEKGVLEEYDMYQVKIKTNFEESLFDPKTYSMN